jgi:alpha-1,2-mannosyltransferase
LLFAERRRISLAGDVRDAAEIRPRGFNRFAVAACDSPPMEKTAFFANKTIRLAALCCGVTGVFAGIFYYRILAGLFGGDFMVYYGAVRAVAEGHAHILYDGAGFTQALNVRFADFLAKPYELHPWLYPPSFLPLLLPFAILPFVPAYAFFMLAGLGMLFAALTTTATDHRESLFVFFATLVAPATAVVLALGQNTFLTAALLIGGISQMRRRPLLAGILLGLLTYKPQFWLMVPIALLASRQWRVLAAALAAAAGLAFISLVLFGTAPWLEWLNLMISPNAQFDHWQTLSRLNGHSLYACAALLGAAPKLAGAVQMTGIGFSAWAVWRCFSRPMPDRLRIAGLLAATVLAAPHVMNYDADLTSIAAALLFVHAARTPRWSDIAVSTVLWLSSIVSPPSVFPVGLALPPLIALFLLRLEHYRELRRLYQTLKPSLTPPA